MAVPFSWAKYPLRGSNHGLLADEFAYWANPVRISRRNFSPDELKQELERRVKPGTSTRFVPGQCEQYFPFDDEIAVIRAEFPAADPANPWQDVKRRLILAGRSSTDLENIDAPTLIALVKLLGGTAKPPAGQPTDDKGKRPQRITKTKVAATLREHAARLVELNTVANGTGAKWDPAFIRRNRAVCAAARYGCGVMAWIQRQRGERGNGFQGRCFVGPAHRRPGPPVWAMVLRQGKPVEVAENDIIDGDMCPLIWRRETESDRRLDALAEWTATLLGDKVLPPGKGMPKQNGLLAWIWALDALADWLDSTPTLSAMEQLKSIEETMRQDWGQVTDEPFPDLGDFEEWERLARRAGVSADRVMDGKYKLREIWPSIRGYMQSLADQRMIAAVRGAAGASGDTGKPEESRGTTADAQLDPVTKAIAIKSQNPSLSERKIADAVGLVHSTLNRNKKWKTAKYRIENMDKRRRQKGSKDADGNLEAEEGSE